MIRGKRKQSVISIVCRPVDRPTVKWMLPRFQIRKDDVLWLWVRDKRRWIAVLEHFGSFWIITLTSLRNFQSSLSFFWFSRLSSSVFSSSKNVSSSDLFLLPSATLPFLALLPLHLILTVLPSVFPLSPLSPFTLSYFFIALDYVIPPSFLRILL